MNKSNEIISHTEAKKMMVKQVKPAHRELLLSNIDHNEKIFSFSSYENGCDVFGEKFTKNIVGKMYKKIDVLNAIEEYKINNNIRNQFEVIIKQEKQLEKEKEMQLEIEALANKIMDNHNNNIEIDLDSDDIMGSFDNFFESVITFEEACEQAKQQLL